MIAGARVAGVGVAPVIDCGVGPGEHGASGGVWGTADACGRRQIDVALAEEICVQRTCFERFHANLRAARTVAATDSTVLGPTA
jgi:hypothetical protein